MLELVAFVPAIMLGAAGGCSSASLGIGQLMSPAA